MRMYCAILKVYVSENAWSGSTQREENSNDQACRAQKKDCIRLAYPEPMSGIKTSERDANAGGFMAGLWVCENFCKRNSET